MAEKKGITWLHLSDWHQGRKEDFDRKVVCNALITDIKNRSNISKDLENIDFIIFSGDVAYHGKKEEYEAARENFLDPVLKATGLSPNRLFIVPGNHDIDRDAFDLLPVTLLDPFESNNQVKEWLKNKRKRDRILEPFEAYRQFVTPYTHQIDPDYRCICIREIQIDAQHDEQKVPKVRVGLLGLNSALMAGRNKNKKGEVKDYGELIVGEPQLYDALEKIESCDVRIAVLHHPLGWLAEFERDLITQHLQNEKGCHFLLCGHQHKSEIYQVTGTNGNCVIIPAGSSYSIRNYYNGYNFVHLNCTPSAGDKTCTTGQGIVYIRRWSDQTNRWIDDVDSAEKGEVLFSLPKKETKSSLKTSHQIDLSGETQIKLKQHFEWLIPKIKAGLVIPFLGADINLCDRPKDSNLALKPWEWDINSEYPPTSVELATYLDIKHQYLENVLCPLCNEETLPSNCPIRTQLVTKLDLQHVSQYLDPQSEGEKNIKETITKIANSDKYKSNILHNFLAQLPDLMNKRDNSAQTISKKNGYPLPLIVTTNFDSTLERAFINAKQPFDLVSYIVDKYKNKRFIHQKFELENESDQQLKEVKKSRTIEILPGEANKYLDFSPNERPVILKLYGSVDWPEDQNASFAITEDHFIDYLGYANSKLENILPQHLLVELNRNSIWFLGYSLCYWHQRAVLHHIWSEHPIPEEGRCWAVHPTPDALETYLWETNHIKLLSEISLDIYIEELMKKLQEY